MSKPVPDINDLNRDYFDGCAMGELRVRLCRSCGARFRFAHEACPQCWSFDLGHEAVSGRGKVSHFCVVHQAPYEAFDDVAPYVLALIELDEGVRMMSNVTGCPPEEVKIGLPVKVRFEQRGPVSLPMFEPDR
jgi:uncharacterized OB-fold protein